jgi:hypothetical protein
MALPIAEDDKRSSRPASVKLRNSAARTNACRALRLSMLHLFIEWEAVKSGLAASLPIYRPTFFRRRCRSSCVPAREAS